MILVTLVDGVTLQVGSRPLGSGLPLNFGDRGLAIGGLLSDIGGAPPHSVVFFVSIGDLLRGVVIMRYPQPCHL